MLAEWKDRANRGLGSESAGREHRGRWTVWYIRRGTGPYGDMLLLMSQSIRLSVVE